LNGIKNAFNTKPARLIFPEKIGYIHCFLIQMEEIFPNHL